VKVESNVQAVIARTQRLQRRDIPAALAAALSPARWKELALTEARATLMALATKDQHEFIEHFLKTLTAEGLSPGFVLRMHTPFGSDQTLGDYQAARQVVKPYELVENLFTQQIQEFESLMTDWVTNEKRKDQRDDGKTDEEIGQFISYLMLNPNPTPREMTARNSLMPHIVDFLQRKQASTRLDAIVVDQWLRAVLAAWRQMVQSLFPEMFHKALLEVRTELPLEATK